VQAKEGVKVADPTVRTAVADVAARLAKLAGVEQVSSPFAKGNEGQISEDGHSALVTFVMPGEDEVTETASTSRSPPGCRCSSS